MICHGQLDRALARVHCGILNWRQALSIWTDSLDAIYDTDVAVDGVLSILTASVRVIDKTAGVDLMPLGKAKVPTIVPAACVRRYELTAAGVTDLAPLLNATLTFNGATWRIVNHVYRPQPGGEMDGEITLILRQLN